MSEFATSRRAKWFMLGSFVAGGLLVGHGSSRAPGDHLRSAPAETAATQQRGGAEGLPWNVEGIIGGAFMLSGVLAAVPRRRLAAETSAAPEAAAVSPVGISIPPLLRVVPIEAA